MAVVIGFVLAVFVLSLIRGAVFGFKRIDRVRGGGWLTCPNCKENARQDVVDQMKFAALVVRFTPVSRQRLLVCRRCGYRRPVSDEEMRALDTAGTSLGRAVMGPVGLVSIIVSMLILNILIFAPSDIVTVSGITLQKHPTDNDNNDPTFQKIGAHITFEAPRDWSPRVNGDFTPPEFIAVDNSGQNLGEYIIRDPATHTFSDMVSAYYSLKGDSIASVGFPKVPPKGSCTKVADQPAYSLTINYTNDEQPAVVLIWIVIHNQVGYAFIFTGQGTQGIKTITNMSRQVIDNVTFTSDDPKPSFTPSPSPSPSPSASPSASPTPAASPSPGGGSGEATPSAAPSPSAPAVRC